MSPFLPILLHRLAQTGLILFLLSLLIFTLFSAIPGDYLSEMELDPAIPREHIAQLRHTLGLEDPVHTRYVRWMGSLARLDLGFSFAQRRPAADLIAERLLNTLLLTSLALLVSVCVAVPLAIVSAFHQNRWPDHLARGLSLGGMSLPTLLTALLLLYFAFWTRLFPIGGFGRPSHTVLPTLTLALPLISFLTRTMRLELIDALAQPFVVVLRSKGLPSWRIGLHALRQALNPLISIGGLLFGGLLSGSVVVERVFGWPGLGDLTVTSILSRDVYVALNCVLLASATVILSNLAADILLALNDPRLRT